MIVGSTLNGSELVNVVEPVVTVTDPENSPAGTVAVMKVVPVDATVEAGVPPNSTTDEPLKP